jgi:Predicted transcriptional regulators
MMDREWNDSQPIYRQLRDRVVAMILDGVLKEGDPLPSVRNVAAEYRVNPLTVLKGYQQLVDERLVETKRGRHVHQCRRAQSAAAGRAPKVSCGTVAGDPRDHSAAGPNAAGTTGCCRDRQTFVKD